MIKGDFIFAAIKFSRDLFSIDLPHLTPFGLGLMAYFSTMAVLSVAATVLIKKLPKNHKLTLLWYN